MKRFIASRWWVGFACCATDLTRAQAANTLQIEGLVQLCCGAWAVVLRDLSPDQIFACFDISKPFTPEEERKILEANPWIRDEGEPMEEPAGSGN